MLNQPSVDPAISRVVREEVRRVLEDRDLPPGEILAEDRLSADLGLTSLDLAQLVAALEIALDADPFQELVAVTSVRTVGDLERAYATFFAGQGPQDDELAGVRRIAEARRASAEGAA